MNTSAGTSNEIIYAEDLVKHFNGFAAVRGVTFSVSRGECFGLLGPNGAGKTTIVKMIYGFSPVTSGELRVFGQNIAGAARDIKARIGVVPQEDNLDPELSVLENLLVYASYFRMNKELALTRAGEVLDFMELTEKSSTEVNNLSGGMKRRLTLGRALINEPEILILDEPTTGLDPYARHLVWQRLGRLKEAGTTMLLTTHYLEEASQLCDRIVIIEGGQILEEGSPQALIDLHVGKDVLELGVSAKTREALLPDVSHLIKDHQLLGDKLLLFTDRGEELANLISGKLTGLDSHLFYRLRPSNLEDVFLKLTGSTLDAPDAQGDSE
ncbi:MAG: ABC transporter [Firmicutes bacterium HGW-Firmicutes-8]|nr:MAG: ABC transporter [Firmicutes bacterium HGW-Firmicutes-8]